ncbi:hypothetical protein R77564_02235 [Ralstonia sp. LMG 32965]|uniref:Uncharacterized protein n=1 Tax=Ralstonia flatus TaxID=3058601 RepID=A0ABM9KS79_9RALS|nr:hypothetical protein R77564_02235 [Ralstonia sp. LMG 32965]
MRRAPTLRVGIPPRRGNAPGRQRRTGPVAPRRLLSERRARRCWARMPMSNLRCRQSNTGAPPSNSGARPSEARTRPKNIRPIGASRAELRRQRLDVDLLRLKRHRPRLEGGCRRSKISSLKSGRRVFEVRLPPAEGRCRMLEGHVPASRARARRFQADVCLWATGARGGFVRRVTALPLQARRPPRP